MERLFVTDKETDAPETILAVTYTVIFHTNGGSDVPSQAVAQGATATRPPTRPTRDGYGFVNWYSDPDCTALYDFNAPVYADITLYAKWGTPYTVIFDSNGGTPVPPNQTVGAGGTASRPANPTKVNYTFGNWYSNSALTGSPYDFSTSVTGNLTLYAKWNVIPVTNISGVPTTATAGTPLTLSGIVTPSTATNKTIVWSVFDEGGTGASISGNTLNTAWEGTVTVRATIANGTAQGTDYTKDFEITVNPEFKPVANITGVPPTAVAGMSLMLIGAVSPVNATNSSPILWSVANAGTTGATIASGSDILNTTAQGTVIVTATIVNGATATTNYTKDFAITVSNVPVTNISDVPTAAMVGTPLTLTGTVVPTNATNKSIAWSVANAGTTGASISGSNTLNATGAGTVTVTATIVGGLANGTAYTKDFEITVKAPAVIDITVEQIEDGSPVITVVGGTPKISISGNDSVPTFLVLNAPAGYFSYQWSIEGVGDNEIPLGAGSSVTVRTDVASYNSIGRHAVHLLVYKTSGGAPYSKNIFIEIVK